MFKNIPGYPGYIVNEEGALFRAPYLREGKNRHGEFSYTTKLKRIKPYEDEYMQVILIVNGKRVTERIHRLVALAFIPNPHNLPQVNHKDGNKYNNHVTNLEWCTASDNVKHSYKKGLASNQGELHPRALLSEAQVKRIKESLGRVSASELAKQLGVSIHAIYDISKGRTWSHVGAE